MVMLSVYWKLKELNTNSNFQISISMQPVGGNFTFFKLLVFHLAEIRV